MAVLKLGLESVCVCKHATSPIPTFELEHVTEVEVPDVLSPTGFLLLCLCLEHQHLLLPAQLKACRVTRDVLIESKVTRLVWERERERRINQNSTPSVNIYNGLKISMVAGSMIW